MSYGIIRIEKYQKTAIKGIEIHDTRAKESITNPDIDTSKKNLNESLLECSSLSKKITERISQLELRKAVRKDAVVMCQVLITSDKDFFDNITKEQEKEFFKNSLEFVEKKYGKENILSATIHRDEKTPHLHVNFVPIIDDRLSAKNLITRQHLRNLHTDFHKEVGENFGLQRGENREEKRRHLDTEEFKIKTRKENLEREYKNLKFNKVCASEFEPQTLKSKFLGLKEEKEDLNQVAKRIYDKYIAPIEHKLSQEKKEHDILKNEIFELKKIADKYQTLKSIFMKNMKQNQFDELRQKAKEYQKQNISEEKKFKEKMEKEQLEKLELEKELKILLKQRDKSYLKGLEHDTQVAEYIKAWKNAENKQEYAFKIKEMLKKEVLIKENNYKKSQKQNLTRIR